MERLSHYSPYFLLRMVIVSVEFVLVNLAFLLSFHLNFTFTQSVWESYLPLACVFALAWTTVGSLVGHYHQDLMLEPRRVTRTLITTLLGQLALVLVFVSSYSVKPPPEAILIYAYVFTLIFIFLGRYAISLAYRNRRMLLGNYPVVIVGEGPAADSVNAVLEQQAMDIHRYSVVAENDTRASVDKVKTELPNIKRFCLENDVQEIYYTLPVVDKEVIQDVLDFADNNYIHVRLANNFEMFNQPRVGVAFYDKTPVITLHEMPLASRYNRGIKRVFDILFSLGVLLFIFPLLYIAVAIAIKSDSRGPVFFKQDRSGRRNRKFLCYKFRTMTVNAESDAKQATKGDMRITRVGAFLRKTSLDEFPQFINVLKGEMSVVGPRPHMLKHTEEYAGQINKFMFRHFVTPGITGEAQVNGFRGETNEPDLMQKRVEHDITYIENWSLMRDLKIIVKTVTNMIKGEENAR